MSFVLHKQKLEVLTFDTCNICTQELGICKQKSSSAAIADKVLQYILRSVEFSAIHHDCQHE